MGKKNNATEIDRRVHTVIKLLSSAKTNSYILRFCVQEWGVQKRQDETYIQRAREIIKADYSVERSDFFGTRLALLEEIIEASIRCKQHNNTIVLEAQAQLTLTGLLKCKQTIKNAAADGACVGIEDLSSQKCYAFSS